MPVDLIKKYAQITATRQAEIRAAKSVSAKLPSSPEKIKEDRISNIFRQRAKEDFGTQDDG